MEHKLTKGPLLNKHGHLNQAGYATTLIKTYNQKDIKASKLRIKEWDYYYLQSKDFAIALTIADNGYMGLLSASLINFKEPSYITKSKTIILPLGKLNLPASSKEGDCIVKKKNLYFAFINKGKERHLNVTFPKFKKNNTLSVDVILDQEPQDSMVIATPFKEKKTAFYYNQKILGMRVKGSISLGEETQTFSKNALGLLDWGRGVWTYKNTWYWGAGHGYINNKIFAFNIGYGFGDTSKASENMLFYDGKAHKLKDITFNIPKDTKHKYQYLAPWTFTSSDQRFEMQFNPILDRKDYISLGVLKSDQHQVFGILKGKAILDDGTTLELDNFIGFAEHIQNKW